MNIKTTTPPNSEYQKRKIPFLKRISTRLVFIFVLLALVPLWTFAIFSYYVYEREVGEDTVQDLSFIAYSANILLKEQLQNFRNQTVSFSSDRYVRNSVANLSVNPSTTTERVALERYLHEEKRVLSNTIKNITIYDVYGNVLASTNEVGVLSGADNDQLKNTLSLEYGEVIISDFPSPSDEGSDRERILTTSVISTPQTDEVVGIMEISFSADFHNSIFSSPSTEVKKVITRLQSRSNTFTVYIVNAAGDFISLENSEVAIPQQSQTVHTKPVHSCTEQKQDFVGAWRDYKGYEVFGAAFCITEEDWTVIATIQKQTLLNSLFLLRDTTLLIGLFLSLIIVGFALYFAYTVTKPIKTLTDAVYALQEGDFKQKITIENNNEIGALAHSFVMMRNSLLEYIESVNKQKEDANTISEDLKKTVTELHRSRTATLNILEDLDAEKRDVEKKIAERTTELEREKEKLSIVASRMLSGTLLLDEHKNVLFANDMMLQILGVMEYSPATLFSEFIDSFSDSEVHTKIEEAIYNHQSGAISELEHDGSIYSMYVKSIEVSKTDKTAPAQCIIFVQNITERKVLERSRSDLIAVASHQLRTPLTAMRGNVEMLTDESYGPLNDEQKELLQDIDISTLRLITMVNDMLDITKIEGKTLDLNIEEVDVRTVIDSIIKDLHEYALQHEFVVTHHASEISTKVYVDRIRIRQVLQNLIDNAIKYGQHPGQLDITYGGDDTQLNITLTDNGIGIPKAEQSHIFSRFYRATNTTKVSSSGSGLGLYIVKLIIESFGGSIRFESEEEKGTTFYISLPRKGALKK